MNGRPLDLRWAADNVPAILDIWYPGTQGGAAVADLLFGDVAPSGKLPFSWPRTVGQVPMIYSHTISHEPGNQGRRYWDEQSTPLFPFGHGLSYGRFEYTDLALDRSSIQAGETVTVSVTVTNVGQRGGDEVAQLYIHQRYGSASRPVRELKGFQRLTFAAGESQTLRFPLGPDELRYWERRHEGLGHRHHNDRRLRRRRLDRRPNGQLHDRVLNHTHDLLYHHRDRLRLVRPAGHRGRLGRREAR
jgi:beta-glucosidase